MLRSEVAQEAVKAAPPVAVTAWSWLHGVSVNDLVGYATLTYIVLQVAYLVWRWVRQIRRGK